MEVRNDTLLFFKATESDACAKLLKRKRARKVAAHISAAKRFGAQWRSFKRIRTADSKNLQRSEGSVAYGWLSSDAYGWPAKTSLVDIGNIQKSGIPLRFMFYGKAEWKEFPADAAANLSESFRAGKNSVELSVNGKKYLVNFLQMMQLNLQTGFLRSIAWIDEHGKYFFPSKFFEGHATQFLTQLPELGVKFDSQVPGLHLCQTLDSTEACDVRHLTWNSVDGFGRHGLLGGTQTLAADVETTSEKCLHPKVGGEASTDKESATVCGSHDFALLGDKLIKLQHGDQEYAVVKNKFLAGLGMLVTYTTVVSIYRESHTSTSGQARLQAFQRQEEIMKKVRGDANLRYAWHGTSKQGVSGIVLHGFGQPRTPKNGTAYGVGVYLAPEDYSHVSAVYSDVDEKGEQHMVLCRVIMGNMEQVHPGSEQFHPTSEDHDSGVDDLLNPKRYIIWSTHMNTHILPQYVISFKISPQWHDVMAALRGKQMTSRGTPLGRLPRLDGQTVSERGAQLKVVEFVSSSSCQFVKNTSDQIESIQGNSKKTPRSPWMSFPMLFYVMRPKLPTTDMMTLQQYYVEFKAGRMSRDALIRNVRVVAGDRVLADSIRSMQAQEKANFNLSLLESCSSLIPQSAPESVNIPHATSCGCFSDKVEMESCSKARRPATESDLVAYAILSTSKEKQMEDVIGGP